jgi:hypothetical protein
LGAREKAEEQKEMAVEACRGATRHLVKKIAQEEEKEAEIKGG